MKNTKPQFKYLKQSNLNAFYKIKDKFPKNNKINKLSFCVYFRLQSVKLR